MRKQSRDPAIHGQCRALAIVHGTVHVHHSCVEVRWFKRMWHSTSQLFSISSDPFYMCQPGITLQNKICFWKNPLIHILQWFPIAHRKKTKSLPGLVLPICSSSYTILLQSLPSSQTGTVLLSQNAIGPLYSAWNVQTTLTSKPVR